MTTVLVADDSPALRERLAALCGEIGTLQVVGEARDCQEAMASVGTWSGSPWTGASSARGLSAGKPRMAEGES